MARSTLAAGAVFWAFSLFSACTGIFQQELPETPASYHRVGTGEVLRVGAAEADITPDGEIYMAGFDFGKVSTGVHAALKARAMVFHLGEMRIAIVGIDNLGVQLDDVSWIKSGVIGYQNGCVFLCSSHTHAAPDLIGLWGKWLFTSGRDRRYVAKLRAGVVEAVELATANARAAVLTRGEARIPPEGLVRNSNRAGLFDPRMNLIQARDAETGAPIGTLIHMACHPEVFGRANTLVSSDFVGGLCDRARDAGMGQPVFINGALGAMVSPHPRGDEGMVTMVDGLAATADRAAANLRDVEVDSIEVRRRDLYMPMTSPGFLLGRLTMVIPRAAYQGQVRSTVGSLRIGPIEIVCVPGEMEPTLAARIRQRAQKPNLLLFGLVDDELGYLMREVDARDPLYDYERTMSPLVDTGERVQEALETPVGHRSR